MEMMEKYQYQLEYLVDERTTELTNEKHRTEMLLQRMLPRYEKNLIEWILESIYMIASSVGGDRYNHSFSRWVK